MKLLQITPAVSDSLQQLQQVVTDADIPSTTINAFDLALKGGWLMIILLILLLLSVYVLIERLLVLRDAGKEDDSFMNRIKDYIHEGKIDSAQALCKKTDHSFCENGRKRYFASGSAYERYYPSHRKCGKYRNFET